MHPDDDNDGLADTLEFESACPYWLVPDSDGDGSVDGFEIATGFDHCNAARKPTWVGGADSDFDKLLDGSERNGYNTCAFTPDTQPQWSSCPVPQDSDGYGCDDIVEVLDINGDRFTDSADAGPENMCIAAKIAPDPLSDAIFDANKDGYVDSGDNGLVNKNTCLTNPRQIGCPVCLPE